MSEEIFKQLNQYYVFLAQGRKQEAERLKSQLTQTIQNLPEKSFESLKKKVLILGRESSSQENWEYACIFFDLTMIISELKGESLPEAKEISAIAHYNYANLLSDTGRVKEAELHYLKALDLKPDDPKAHNNYANLLANTGKLKQAKKHYLKALKLNPDSSEAHNNYAVLLANTGKLKQAKKHYLKALKLNPDSPLAHNNYAVLLANTGRLDEAEEHYLKALQLNPDYPLAHNNYANLLAKSGKIKQAEEHYLKALKLKPDFAQVHNNYAIILDTTGRNKEAEGYFKRASELALEDKLIPKETCIGIQKNYAYFLYELQKYQESRNQFKRAYLLDRSKRYLLLWSIYQGYLDAEFNQSFSISEEERKNIYEQKLHHLISEVNKFQAQIEKDTEKANYKCKIIKKIFSKIISKIKGIIRLIKPKDTEIELERALSWSHYFRAVIFCKLGDYHSAYWHSRKAFQTHPRMKCFLVRFWRWLRGEKEYYYYKALLYYIWNYRLCPPFYRWWMGSPEELGYGIKWIKRGFFLGSIAILGYFLLYILLKLSSALKIDHFIKSSFLSDWFKQINQSSDNWHLIFIGIILILALWLAPQLARFKAGDYEIEVMTPSEITLTPIMVEPGLPLKK